MSASLRLLQRLALSNKHFVSSYVMSAQTRTHLKEKLSLFGSVGVPLPSSELRAPRLYFKSQQQFVSYLLGWVSDNWNDVRIWFCCKIELNFSFSFILNISFIPVQNIEK